MLHTVSDCKSLEDKIRFFLKSSKLHRCRVIRAEATFDSAESAFKSQQSKNQDHRVLNSYTKIKVKSAAGRKCKWLNSLSYDLNFILKIRKTGFLLKFMCCIV